MIKNNFSVNPLKPSVVLLKQNLALDMIQAFILLFFILSEFGIVSY